MAHQPAKTDLSKVAPAADEPTIGRLVNDATRDISTLVKKEIELAKSELKVSVRFGLTGVVFFVLAAFLALLAIIMLSVAFAYLIHWNGSAFLPSICSGPCMPGPNGTQAMVGVSSRS